MRIHDVDPLECPVTSLLRPFSTLLFVLAVALAGCGGDGGDTGDDGDAAAGQVSVVGTDDLKFRPDQLQAAAGEVTVEMTCEEGINHNFVVEEIGDEMVVECDAGETATGTVELEPGTYTFYCNIAGHREAGMEGTLVVE